VDYIKLSNLVGEKMTIEKVWGYKFKMWDQPTNKMIVQDSWFKGARKVYEVDTDKGKMDLGQGQIGTLLELVMRDGVADLNQRTFEVKSNGKTGMDIRYYFNPVEQAKKVDKTKDIPLEDEISLDEVDWAF
jgi:hypothetical protein